MKNTLNRLALFCAIFLFSTGPIFSQVKTIPEERGEVLIYQGIELHDSARYEEAIAKYDLVHPQDSNYYWAVYEKALSLSENDQKEEVVKVLEEALKTRNDYTGEMYIELANAYDDLGDSLKALKTYDRAIAFSPMNPELYFNKAITLYRMKDYEKAFEQLKIALRINPFHASSHFLVASMALANDEIVPATLAFSAYLVVQPTTERSFNALVTINNALSEKTEVSDLGFKLAGDEKFGKADLLVRNYAGLSDSYETPSELDIPFIKQAHVVFDQAKPSREGFFSEFYLPYFKEVIKDDDRFEMWSYLVSITSKNEKHQKIFEKNIADIKEFVSWSKDEWIRLHQDVEDTLQGKKGVYRYGWRTNNTLEVIGAFNEKSQNYDGFVRIFYSGGTLRGTGYFDKNGKRTGTWRFYHANGNLEEELSYKDGEIDGESRVFDKQGRLTILQHFKEGKLDGDFESFYPTGQTRVKTFYVNGENQKEYTSYFASGVIDFQAPVKDGKIEGEAKWYFPDGKLSAKAMFVDGSRNGDYENYHQNGELRYKLNYVNGEIDGPYVEYASNGTKISEGTMKEGAKVGKWTYWQADGTLKETAEFDESGKETGFYVEYDRMGRINSEMEYRKGEFIGYKYFDEDGKVILEERDRKGRFKFTGYHTNRAKAAEGEFEDSERIGEWTFFNEYGNPVSIENYKDGQIDGRSKYYYSDGNLQRVSAYRDGQSHGLSTEYYPNGALLEQGVVLEDQRQREWVVYNPDSTWRANTYWVDGEREGWNHYFNFEGKPVQDLYLNEGLIMGYRYYGPNGRITGEGSFEDGNGSMEFKYSNGQLAASRKIEKGLYNGEVVEFYPDGSKKLEGNYLHGRAYGKWTWYHPNGKVETVGEHLYGERSGVWRWYDEDGSLINETNYLEGLSHGRSPRYDEDGNLTRIYNYHYGDYHGPQHFFAEDSLVELVRYYSFGTLIGYSYLGKDGQLKEMIPVTYGDGEVKAFFPNGKPSRTFTYKDGEFEGPYKIFYPNGQVREDFTVNGGRITGMEKHYYPDGTLKKTLPQLMDEYHGEVVSYHPNGKVERKEHFVHGEKNGFEEVYDAEGKLVQKILWFNDIEYEME
ncbi:MAG: tetratricopeptide repeat protein [Bacteroidota bacterium]|nr:tetratricopeptide repeat protein [Bacteroidota bacterium]